MNGGEPCAVVMWMRDGTILETVYASRWLAELFLAALPGLMTTGEWDDVTAAMLSPLVGAGEGQAVLKIPYLD